MTTDAAGGRDPGASGGLTSVRDEDGTYRGHHDPRDGEVGVTVTLLLARVADRPVTELAGAVQQAVDGDALDQLVGSSAGLSAVEFTAAGYDIQVRGDGEIHVAPSTARRASGAADRGTPRR